MTVALPMEHPGFFKRKGPFSIDELASACDAVIGVDCDSGLMLEDVRPLDVAQHSDISFIDNTKYLEKFSKTKAGACFVKEQFADRAPKQTIPLISERPYHSFAKVLGHFYPTALSPSAISTSDHSPTDDAVHPSAELEEDVTVEHGAKVGPEARIGRGTKICSGAIIGYRSYIGRNCYIGPNTNITNTLMGNRVIILSGASIGQDGFGFAMGPEGHLKVPQIGRVIIQDDVEIGANSTVDRGVMDDTIIGEGTKIDNLVQIGHNVVIGRHCVLVALTGIAGSTQLGDFVVMGGHSGAAGHLKIGAGAQVAAAAKVTTDIGPGGKWAGFPAVPFRVWAKKIAILKRLAERPGTKESTDTDE